MAEEQSGVTSEDKDQKLSDGIRDLLIERINSKTLTAAEMKVAIDLLEKRGYKFVEPKSKATSGGRQLPTLPPIPEEEIIRLDNGVEVRQPR